MDVTWYSSVAGIVAATIVITQIIKRAAGNVPYLGAVPTWVVAVVVAGILSTCANVWWHVLPGNPLEVITQSVMLAAMAAGFKEWLDPKTMNLTKPMSMSDTARRTRTEVPL